MAYFSNSSAGVNFDQGCMDCPLADHDDFLCPIAKVQLAYNYEQVGNRAATEILEALVDQEDGCMIRDRVLQLVQKEG